MPHVNRHQRRPWHPTTVRVAAEHERRGALPVILDLRRADLYRILDEIVRAPADRRAEVIGAFEQAWKDFKEAMARAG